MDRANWRTSLNLSDVNNNIEQVLRDYTVATKLETTAWMDKEGKQADNEDDESFGMKCTIGITHPGMAITLDKARCNIPPKGNRAAAGGATYICAMYDQSYQSTTNKDSHFILCLGLSFFVVSQPCTALSC